MKNKDACVNSHEPAVDTSAVSTNTITELDCSFTRVSKNGKTALLACMNIQAQTSAGEALSALLHHAEELNLRLPFLRVSVRVNADTQESNLETTSQSASDTPEKYLFVLHGLSYRSITARDMSNFLNRLTQDFKVFLAYAKAHNIRLQPSLEDSAIKPFA